MIAETSARSPIPDEEDPTLVVSRPGPTSTIRPSDPSCLDHSDTLVDPLPAPQPVPWYRLILSTSLGLAAFLLGVVTYPVRAYLARFDEPPLTELLPKPPPQPKNRYHEALSPAQLGEQIAHDLFRLSPEYTRGILRIARLVHEMQNDRKEDRLDLFVMFVVSRLAQKQEEPVPIAWIRERLPEYQRREINDALWRLEEQKYIRLFDNGTEDPGLVARGISDPARGQLTHVEVRAWL